MMGHELRPGEPVRFHGTGQIGIVGIGTPTVDGTVIVWTLEWVARNPPVLVRHECAYDALVWLHATDTGGEIRPATPLTSTTATEPAAHRRPQLPALRLTMWELHCIQQALQESHEALGRTLDRMVAKRRECGANFDHNLYTEMERVSLREGELRNKLDGLLACIVEVPVASLELLPVEEPNDQNG